MVQYSKFHYFLWSLPFALWGYLNDLGYSIIFAEVFFTLLCVYSDYTKGARSISFITIYSLFTLSYSYGNFLVLRSIGTPEEAVYDYYLVKENIPQALMFTYIANVFCVLGFTFYQSTYHAKNSLMAVMRIEIPPKFIHYVLIGISMLNGLVLMGKLNYTTMFPFIIAGGFFLTRYAADKNNTTLLNFCMMNTMVLSLNGFLFDYLRMSTIAPGVSFLIAVFFGREKVGTCLLYTSRCV